MPYESPNIVILPTKLIDKKDKSTKNTPSSYKTNIPIDVFEPSPKMPSEDTKPTEEASKSTNKPPSDTINEISKENVKTASLEIIPKPNVYKSYSANKNMSSENSKKQKPTSWAFNYLQSISQNSNAKPVQVNLLSTSNDVIKQAANSTEEIQNKEIKINLLSHPNVAKTTVKARKPLLQIPNFSSDVKSAMDPKRCRPPLLQPPKNRYNNSKSCKGPTCTCSSLLQNPINTNVDNVKTSMNLKWINPSLLANTPNLMDPRTCRNTTWIHPSQLQTPTNLDNDPIHHMDTTWGYPSVYQTSTNPYIDPGCSMDTWTCLPPLPNSLNFNTIVRPDLGTETWATQESYSSIAYPPNKNISPSNIRASLDREPQTTNTKPHDTQSLSSKSRMDYTWLTRAHYANSNLSTKNTCKINTKNTEKYVERKTREDQDKKLIKTTSTTGRASKLRNSKIDKTKSKDYSKEQLLSDTNTNKIEPVQKTSNIKKCTNKEMRDKEKSNIRKAIKSLENKIKHLRSVPTPYKIPKLSNSKEQSKMNSTKTSETSSTKNKAFAKDIIPDKSESKVKEASKNNLEVFPCQEKTSKKRVRHNSGNNDESISKVRKLPHGKISESEKNHRKSGIEISTHSKSGEKMHTYNKSRNNKFVNRSEKVETRSSDKLQKKRKLGEFSCESSGKKRCHEELENIGNREKMSHIKSVVTSKKTTVKHPRIQAPESDESDDDIESDFDLRSKLSRNCEAFKRNKISHKHMVNNQSETPRQNLLITVNQSSNDETTASSKPGPSIAKQKTKKYKKIRLVINVIQEDTSDDSSSDSSKETIVNHTDESDGSFGKQKLDLSFLDDFNIDEIVNSLKQNPIVENVQQNITQKMESNKFVQPIIVRTEFKNEHVDSEIQSNVDYVQKNNTHNISNSEPLQNVRERSGDIHNEVNIISNNIFAQNIKQEKHVDQAENLNTNNIDTAITYLQTSLDEDVLLTVNHLVDIVAENMHTVVDTPSAEKYNCDIKSEPCEMYDNSDTNQSNEPENLWYIHEANEVLTSDIKKEKHEDLKEKINIDNTNSALPYHQISLDEDVLRTVNQLVRIVVENMQTVIDTPGVEKCISSIKSVVYENDDHQESTLQNIFSDRNKEVLEIDEDDREDNNNDIINSCEKNKIEINSGTDTILLEKVCDEKPAIDILAKCDMIEDKCDTIIITKAVDINNVNKTEETEPKIQEKTFKDKSAINTLVISSVTNNNSHKICSEIVNVEQENATKTIQPEVKNNSVVLSNIENNYDVKNNTEAMKITDVNINEITRPKVVEVPITNTLVKCDITENENNVFDKIKEVPNLSADTRTVTIQHPSLKSNKVLAIKIEERILSYLNLKLNVISLIHTGKFAKVFRCKDTNGQNYALKIAKGEQYHRLLGFEKEKMWNKLQHDIPKSNLNTVYLINGFSLDRKWCSLMEYYPINLAQALRNTLFNIDTVQELAKQLVSAVLMIRSNNMVHSDIKPTHILLNSTYKKLKVCGFDACYYANSSVEALPNIGTVHYRAPEIILGYSAGFSIDIWATALVIYEMVTGMKLFESEINYNNNVLFNQMCLCGQLPIDMVLNSRFSSSHFVGTEFKRIIGPRRQYVLYNIHNFNSKTKMYNFLTTIWNYAWFKSQSKAKKATYRAKLSKMSWMLDKMLVLDPRRRISIEFVYADPFFK